MTIRAPLFSNRGIARAPVDLLSWSQGVPPGVLSNPLPPIRQSDWPNPVLARPNLELRTWINGLPPQAAASFIQSAHDWTNPRGPTRATDLLTWANGVPESALGNPLPPIRQTEWPNPLPPRQNLELRTWTQDALLFQPGTFIPNQTDWPVPKGRQWPLELLTWTHGVPQPNLGDQTPPIRQTEWPNPVQRIANLELRTWIQAVPQLQPPAGYNIAQLDWPVPKGASRALDLLTWVNGIPQAALSAQTPPLSTAQWDIQFANPVNLELRSWFSSVILIPTQVPQVIPAQASQDAGRRVRYRDIYRITIDGQKFECRSLVDALQLLDRAKAVATQVAAQAVRKATEIRGNQPKPLAITQPKIEVNTRELRAAVTETKREIAAIYRKALIDSEIAMLFELDARTAHNEDAIILLM